MIGDFNIRDSSQNSNFPHHSIHRDILIDITNFFNLELSKPTNCLPARALDNQHDSNLVIDLIFLRPKSSEQDSHFIHLDWKLILDYTLLTVNIAIFEEHVQTKKHTIVKNSKGEDNFVNKLIKTIKKLNIENILNKEVLEHII